MGNVKKGTRAIEEVQYLSNESLQKGSRENEEIEMIKEIIKDTVPECLYLKCLTSMEQDEKTPT